MRFEMAVGGLRYGAEAGDEVGYDLGGGGRDDVGVWCPLGGTASRGARMVTMISEIFRVSGIFRVFVIFLISMGGVKVVTGRDRGHVVAVVGRGAESEIHCLCTRLFWGNEPGWSSPNGGYAVRSGQSSLVSSRVSSLVSSPAVSGGAKATSTAAAASQAARNSRESNAWLEARYPIYPVS